MFKCPHCNTHQYKEKGHQCKKSVTQNMNIHYRLDQTTESLKNFENSDFKPEKTIQVPFSSNETQISISRDITAWKLQVAVSLLMSIQYFHERIVFHICYQHCFLCALKQSQDSNDSRNIYVWVTRILNKNVILLNFEDSVELILKCIHYFHVNSVSDKSCNYQCIAHELFAINCMEKLTCVCGSNIEIFWSQLSFIFPLNCSNTEDSTENLIFNNRSILDMCPAALKCKTRKSVREFYFIANKKYIMLQINNGFQGFSFRKFKQFQIPDSSTFYKIVAIIGKQDKKIFIFTEEHNNWNCKSQQLFAQNIDQLEEIFRKCLIDVFILVFQN